MGRLRQYNPNNYNTSRSIHDDFENIVRYLVAGERGNRSYSEMFQDLFDDDGKVDIGVRFSFDSDGLKMRVGEGDWEILAPVQDLRGSPGRDVGNVSLPIITGLTQYTATAGQTIFAYVHNATDTLFVSKNGLLQASPSSYTSNSATGTITLSTAAEAGDVFTVYKVRGDAGIISNRVDIPVTAASQAVFGLAFPSNNFQLLVYLNGLLLAENVDYVISRATSSITLLDAAIADDTLSAVFMSSSGATEIPGFMLEGVYTDMDSGLIPIELVKIGNDEIPVAKIDGLAATLNTVAKISVGSGTPTNPESGDFWLDTSKTPADLKIYDASDFVSVTPSTSLPAFRLTDAGYAVFINSTGTGYVYKPIDFSSLIPNVALAAPGGVATLDAGGKLEVSQYPLVRTTDVITHKITGAIENGTVVIRRLFRERVRIIGHSVQTKAGSCTIQLGVSGAGIGSTYSAATTPSDQNLSTVIEVDATVLSKTLEVIVSGVSSATDLDLTIAIERLN